IAVAAAIVALLVSNLLTDARFLHRWSQNPSKKYVDTLTASVRTAGPGVNLWDGQVPQSVLTFLSSGNHISDVLRLAGVPAQFEQPGSDPMIVKADGTLAPAGLFAVAKAVQKPHTACTLLIQGTGTWIIPLSSTPAVNEYFVKISYFQQKPSILNIALHGPAGVLIEPVGGQRTQLNDRLGNVYFRLPLGSPRSLVVQSDNLDSNICIGDVSLGVPFALQGK
ncbi:MAG: hypothetical protein M3Y42_20815, partial [Actinomycetota bacterium]|nr:hypothetical protein [Actinomycetota bacterium]